MKLSLTNKTKPNENPVYMNAKQGPFRCSNCEYFNSPNHCIKPEMIKVQDANPAIVEAGGCCNYFEKK